MFLQRRRNREGETNRTACAFAYLARDDMITHCVLLEGKERVKRALKKRKGA